MWTQKVLHSVKAGSHPILFHCLWLRSYWTHHSLWGLHVCYRGPHWNDLSDSPHHPPNSSCPPLPSSAGRTDTSQHQSGLQDLICGQFQSGGSRGEETAFLALVNIIKWWPINGLIHSGVMTSQAELTELTPLSWPASHSKLHPNQQLTELMPLTPLSKLGHIIPTTTWGLNWLS